jgi:site-specific DNA recombinase
MIAAIYARKSTDQNGVADDQKSVVRQIDHAREYATKKGWVMDDASIFVDDGISGAEFANRPGFLRLMNSLKPRPVFQMLVMSEESRLGREAIETAYALKQLVQAGVRGFFYMEDRERTLDSPTDKIMLSLTTFADELEREKARQRTYDAMQRKARAGHVTGGRVFGYDNIEVLGADGKRSHGQWRINEHEAAVVRMIFERCAAGTGYTRIAKQLNDERAPCPRPQQDRPAGWAPSSIHQILKRSLYRGEIVWNQTRKRDRWGRTDATARPESEWLSVHAPDLRIVSEALWTAARARLTGITAKLMATSGGRIGRRARDVESVHLLTGFARCAVCGSSFYPLSRSHGRERAFFYGCSANHKRGHAVCGNGLVMRKERIDEAVLKALGGDVLRPAVVNAVLEGLWAAMHPQARGESLQRVRGELATVEREIARLTDAIASGGPMETLLAAVKVRQTRHVELQQAIVASEHQQGLARRPSHRRAARA